MNQTWITRRGPALGRRRRSIFGLGRRIAGATLSHERLEARPTLLLTA